MKAIMFTFTYSDGDKHLVVADGLGTAGESVPADKRDEIRHIDLRPVTLSTLPTK